MKYLSIFFLLLLITACNGNKADIPAAEHEAELEELLQEFLRGASVSDPQIHERFWADDLIYTSSAGERFGKQTIMDGLEDADPETEPTIRYDYTDLEIRIYDQTAIIAFRLIGETMDDHGEITGRMEYLNSGTFVKHDDGWRAVNWQATRAAESP